MGSIEVLAILGFTTALCTLINSIYNLKSSIHYQKAIVKEKTTTANIFIVCPNEAMRFFLGIQAKRHANVFAFADSASIDKIMEKGIFPKLIIVKETIQHHMLQNVIEIARKHKLLNSVKIICITSFEINVSSEPIYKYVDMRFAEPIDPVRLEEMIMRTLQLIPGWIPNKRKFELKNIPHTRYDYIFDKMLFKRAFDVIVSILLIILLMPVLIFIVIGIQIDSKGPTFYRAKRAGKGYKIFQYYKFRTMAVNADKLVNKLAHLNQYSVGDGKPFFFKVVNDPRITKFGSFLRNTSLDEIPSLFNILKGDISFIGNRPLPLYEASTLTSEEFVERFLAPAGIFGLWQLKKWLEPYQTTERRISMDIYYARTHNTAMDLWIFVKSAALLIKQKEVV